MTPSRTSGSSARGLLLLVSLVVAFAAFAGPMMVRPGAAEYAHFVATGGTTVWLALAFWSVVRWGRIGAWVLLGSPFALHSLLGTILEWFQRVSGIVR